MTDYDSDDAQVGEDWHDVRSRIITIATGIEDINRYNNFWGWFNLLIRSPEHVFLGIMRSLGLGDRALLGLRRVNRAQATEQALNAVMVRFGGADRFPPPPAAFERAPWLVPGAQGWHM